MSAIPDFTETELWTVRTALRERYGQAVPVELADIELRLPPTARHTTPCPGVFWSAQGANFVIAKVGEGRYYAQFFYRGYEQYGTGRREWDNLAECVTALLQVQADHARQRAGVASGSTGADFKDGGGD